MDFDPNRDYPLGTQRPDLVSTPGRDAADRGHARRAPRREHRRGRDSRHAGDAAPPVPDRPRRRAGAARGEPGACLRARCCPGRAPARRLHRAPPAPSDRGRARGVGRAARVSRSRTNGELRQRSGRRVRRAGAARRCVAAASSRARVVTSIARPSSRRFPSSAWSRPTGLATRSRSSSSTTASSPAWTVVRQRSST